MYTLNITGHHITINDSIKELVKDKMDHLARINNHITSANVVFNTEKNGTHHVIAEASVHIPGHDLFATAKTDKQLPAALDAVVHKLETQLKKHKQQHSGRVHHLNAQDVEPQSERAYQEEFNELVDRDVLN